MTRLHEVDLTEDGERFRVAVYELTVDAWRAGAPERAAVR
jgi:hypothetical protein